MLVDVNPDGSPFVSQLSSHRRFDAWTPMANLSYQLTDDAMVYLTWSRGFKAGGFNNRINPSFPNTLEPFDDNVLPTA
ncbi:MAG: TonB-dependent receptor [Myxococcota bacterium]